MLRSLGYFVQFQVIDANHFSCQKRERVYIVASLKQNDVFPLDLSQFSKSPLKNILVSDDDITSINILSQPQIDTQKYWRQERVSINGNKTGALKFPDSIDSHCRCLMKNEGVRELTVIPFKNGYRKLTALEYFRLQTFTDADYFKLNLHFTESQLKQLMGNSVNAVTISHFIDLFLKTYPK